MIRINKYELKSVENPLTIREEGWVSFLEAKDRDTIIAYVEEDDEAELVPVLIHVIETGQEVQDDWLNVGSVKVPYSGVRHLYIELC